MADAFIERETGRNECIELFCSQNTQQQQHAAEKETKKRAATRRTQEAERKEEIENSKLKVRGTWEGVRVMGKNIVWYYCYQWAGSPAQAGGILKLVRHPAFSAICPSDGRDLSGPGPSRGSKCEWYFFINFHGIHPSITSQDHTQRPEPDRHTESQTRAGKSKPVEKGRAAVRALRMCPGCIETMGDP
jgi:hypothetical protein